MVEPELVASPQPLAPSRQTIYAVLPMGSAHGWGVCGKYLSRELARLADVRLVAEPFDLNTVGDELDFYDLLPLVATGAERERLLAPAAVGAPVLNYIPGKELAPSLPNLRGTRNVGYTFFEENLLPAESIQNAARYFDIVATGSSWCTDVLRSYGLERVETVIQGVDTSIFRPAPNGKELFRDRFVVFSGGKLEFRKGQDIVIQAFKAFQQRHDDVLLVNAWNNPWDFSLATMAVSTYIRFAPRAREHVAMVSQVLADNGIDLSRAIIIPARPNAMMARVYQNSDVGLFPNRCEGGTNLVLMEYMACGRPAIASNSSGHKDVVNDSNALLVKTMGQVTMSDHGAPIAVWDDPSIDETIEQLEWAYQHRPALEALAEQAGRDMAHMTWKRSAADFYAMLTDE
ncbi:MAG TPA: glycosyltransferase family 4 protein [Chloroflexota bacterium]